MLRPVTTVLRGDFYDDPELTTMEFRLTYEGELRAATHNDSKVANKHHIRKQLHKQLARLWEITPALNDPDKCYVKVPGYRPHMHIAPSTVHPESKGMH